MATEREYKVVVTALGEHAVVPVPTPQDWIAVCSCGKVCGWHDGRYGKPDDDKYIACPYCGRQGFPSIVWKSAAEEN